MRKSIKRSLVICTIVVIVLILYFIVRLNSRVLFNDDSIIGNTAANLYNGGMFCERDGIIYFSNSEDDGALYSMNMSLSDVKKLSTDKPLYINADDNYIYYTMANYTQKKETGGPFTFYNYGLYRIDKDGGNKQRLSNMITGAAGLFGNYIYFQGYIKEVGIDLYKIKIDGTDNALISTANIEPLSARDRLIYYAPISGTDDHYIHTLDLDNDSDNVLYSGNCYMPIAASKDLFYISLEDGYSICRLDYSDFEKEIIVNEFCCFYNISDDENIIYFQIDGGDDNRFAKMDLATMTQETIMDGNYKNIHVIGDYVFFRDFKELNTYVYNAADGSVSIFKAPAIKKK